MRGLMWDCAKAGEGCERRGSLVSEDETIFRGDDGAFGWRRSDPLNIGSSRMTIVSGCRRTVSRVVGSSWSSLLNERLLIVSERRVGVGSAASSAPCGL